MGFVSFTILIWEHALTFADEVEYIWRGKKGWFIILFFINRYVTPLSFVVNLFAYLSPSWSPERCAHFVRYEGAMIVIGLNVTGLMMLMRISALYRERRYVVWGTACLLATEFSVNAWLVSHGKPVSHINTNHVLTACTMIFDTGKVPKAMAAASAWLPLLYDTVILLLTLNRTLGPVRNKTAGRVMKVLLRDGMLYYSVIFSVNLVLTLMIVAAPPGVQNITAQTEQLFTVAMMSRITIHLRKQARANTEVHSQTTISHHFEKPFFARLRQSFSPCASQARADPPIAVNVQESFVTHDDHGVPVSPGSKATEEWFEMRRPSSALLSPHSKRESQLRFVV